MKTEKELYTDMMEMTTKIENRFPEILKYIDEMPSDNSYANHHHVDGNEMADYNQSLNALFGK